MCLSQPAWCCGAGTEARLGSAACIPQQSTGPCTHRPPPMPRQHAPKSSLPGRLVDLVATPSPLLVPVWCPVCRAPLGGMQGTGAVQTALALQARRSRGAWAAPSPVAVVVLPSAPRRAPQRSAARRAWHPPRLPLSQCRRCRRSEPGAAAQPVPAAAQHRCRPCRVLLSCPALHPQRRRNRGGGSGGSWAGAAVGSTATSPAWAVRLRCRRLPAAGPAATRRRQGSQTAAAWRRGTRRRRQGSWRAAARWGVLAWCGAGGGGRSRGSPKWHGGAGGGHGVAQWGACAGVEAGWEMQRRQCGTWVVQVQPVACVACSEATWWGVGGEGACMPVCAWWTLCWAGDRWQGSIPAPHLRRSGKACVLWSCGCGLAQSVC